MAVSFVSASNTGGTASVSSLSVAVPASVVANDIVVCCLTQWQPGVTPVVTAPAGFTQALGFSSNDGAAKNSLWWKRLTGADTGTYGFTWTGGAFWSTLQAVALRGVIASGDPISTKTTSAVGTFGSITTLTLSTGITAGDAGVWMVYNDSAGAHTPPTGFTEAADVDSATTAYIISAGTSISAAGASITSSSSSGVGMVALTQATSSVTHAVAGTVTTSTAVSGTLVLRARAQSAVETISAVLGAPSLRAVVAGIVSGAVSATTGTLTLIATPQAASVTLVSQVNGQASLIDPIQDAAGTVSLTTQVTGAVTRIPGGGNVATDLLGPTMAAMLACADASLTPAVGRAALYPGGQVAWDDCCEGQVWVRLISMTPLANIASGQGGGGNLSTPCGPLMWIATFGVGSLRCANSLDDNGNAPSPTVLTSETNQMTLDMSALMQALQCCFGPQVGKMNMLRWDPLGPDGGCVGGEWTLQVWIDNCGCS